ncbi:hypothetical protein ACJ73_03788 [Blastomyces percursus]|uniref:Uncharacterized protein n=1 Tax=Blastomyces percursus TaxID=1658174 RepID=A0A1J9RB11_9EURO|nr:hypothetical protein ACJ73_03788 [Blastomyces percursus]
MTTTVPCCFGCFARINDLSPFSFQISLGATACNACASIGHTCWAIPQRFHARIQEILEKYFLLVTQDVIEKDDADEFEWLVKNTVRDMDDIMHDLGLRYDRYVTTIT